MAHIYTADGASLATAMTEHLNSWEPKPATVLLEDLEDKAPSMMLQQLGAAEKVKTYINGDYIGVWPFAVYVRINAEDSASRVDATKCLQDLADWLQELGPQGDFLHLPAIDECRVATKIEMTMTPALAERGNDGIEDYQAVFNLEYKVKIRRK